MRTPTLDRGGRSLFRLLAMLLALLMTSAACGSDSDGESSSAETTDEDGAADGGSATDSGSATDDADDGSSGSDTDSGTDEAVAAPTGTLQVAAATNVQSYDAHMAAVAQEYYLHPVYDTLVRVDVDGAYLPGLAQSWEWVDNTTLVLELQPDVVFSDGSPVDAAAVVANVERGMATEASPSAGFYANITSVEATGDLGVQLSLAAPSTSMLNDLARLPGMMMAPSSFDGDPNTEPIGAGGWTLDTAASNPGEVQVYRANPTYWQPSRVLVETVEIRVLESDAASNAMLSGQIDLMELRSEADAPTFEGGGFEMLTRPSANVWYIQMMDTDGSILEPLGDVRVRQALNLAIDRNAFNQGLQFGQGDPSPSFWLPGTAYYDDALEGWAYDPDRARDLLADAGYPDGFSVTFPSFGPLVPVAEAVQQMWGEIGVDVSVELVEPGTLAAVMRDGETVLTPTLARGFTAESHYKERLAPGSPFDSIGTDRGDLPELADAAYQADGQEAQDAAWRELYRYAIDEGYLIVIGHQIPTVVASERVEGAVMLPSDNLPQPYGVSVPG